MTENTTAAPTPAIFDAATVAAASPAERDAFNAAMTKAGFNKDAIDTALAGPLSPPVPQTLDPVTKTPRASNDEKAAMATALKKFWTGDPKVLEDALKAEGVSTEQPSIDPRSEAEKDFDATFAGADPAAYNLNYVGRANGVPTGELAALDGELRSALSAMGVPALIGPGIVDAMLDSAERFHAIPEGPQRALYQAEQCAAIDRLGSDFGSRERLLAFAAHAISRVDKAFFADLVANGSFESAASVLQLARQGQRLFHREQLAEKRGGRK